MNFEAMFKYQEIDKELYKIENEIKSSDEMKKVSAAKNAMNEAAESIHRLNAESGETYKQYDKSAAELQVLFDKAAEIEKLQLETTEIKEIEYYEAKLNALLERADSVKKEFDKLSQKCDQLKANYDKLLTAGMSYNESFKKATEQLNSLKREKMDSANEIMKQLAEVKKEIEPNILSAYDARRQNKKLPVFVKYDKDNQSCLCGMNLPSDCTGKLKNKGDMAECPNCTRLLIVTE
jgi:predicted  nucleic acid-binding Zn-ribbon protein